MTSDTWKRGRSITAYPAVRVWESTKERRSSKDDIKLNSVKLIKNLVLFSLFLFKLNKAHSVYDQKRLSINRCERNPKNPQKEMKSGSLNP